MFKYFFKFPDPHPDMDDVQNLISSSPSEVTSVVKYHQVPISNFHMKLLTDKQKNNCQVKLNLLGVADITLITV